MQKNPIIWFDIGKDGITCLGLDIELIIIAWYNEKKKKNRMKKVFVVIE